MFCYNIKKYTNDYNCDIVNLKTKGLLECVQETLSAIQMKIFIVIYRLYWDSYAIYAFSHSADFAIRLTILL